jgi:hypothetical protein
VAGPSEGARRPNSRDRRRCTKCAQHISLRPTQPQSRSFAVLRSRPAPSSKARNYREKTSTVALYPGQHGRIDGYPNIEIEPISKRA